MNRRLLGLVAACSLLAACGGGDDASPSTSAPTTTTSTSTTTTTAPPTFTEPLTGRVVGAPITRPALVVKVDGVKAGRPQAGLNQADIVFEEKVEGNFVRFAAVFHSREAVEVGPVRSVRSTDADLVKPLSPLFAYSGGIPPFQALLAEVSYDIGFDNQPGLYDKKSGRRAPYNLFLSTPEALSVGPAPEGLAQPTPMFTYLEPGKPFTYGNPVNVVEAKVSNSTSSTWTYDPASYVWLRAMDGSPHVLVDGSQIAVINVVVLNVDYVPTGYKDQANSPVEKGQSVGSGTGWVMSVGRITTVTWQRASSAVGFTLTGADGLPVDLVPGNTWVTLAPQTGTVTPLG